jgi:hypothetical protein
MDGWKIGGMLFIGGVDARKKALAVAAAVPSFPSSFLSFNDLTLVMGVPMDRE